nr:flagellar basal body-associated FliL family protein [Methylomarinum sp. Ch1-1]MDP4519876.1 flagellar basal body-associated FliL family protein [Methylomarinum sp. Ch1-1]
MHNANFAPVAGFGGLLREATLRCEAALRVYIGIATVGWIRRQAIRLDTHNANFASGGGVWWLASRSHPTLATLASQPSGGFGAKGDDCIVLISRGVSVRVFVLWFCLLTFSSFAYAEEAAEQEKASEMAYLEMKPKFTVNLAERRKYLMINVQLLIEGERYIEKVKKHMPLLRHELIMLYSGLPADQLQTMEQREALRLKTKRRIVNALDKYENSDGFRDVFFTEFLVN